MSSTLSIAVTVVAVVAGLWGMAAAVHLGVLATASLFYRSPSDAGERRTRFLTFVPAHDEELVIGQCLAALTADRRPDDIVLVVADRCRDATAAIARDMGALVVEHGEDEEPGRAAARQAGLEVARTLPDWDAVVMIDADSVIEPGFYDACERALATGAPAVQARSEGATRVRARRRSHRGRLHAAGRDHPRGRDRLLRAVRLRGTGMAIRRDVALGHRFHAPASEDLFFTIDLLLDGIRCRHVDDARLVSAGAPNWQTFGGQKVRYEAGRMAGAASVRAPAAAPRRPVPRHGLPRGHLVPRHPTPRRGGGVAPHRGRPGGGRGGVDGRRGVRRRAGRARPHDRHRPGAGRFGSAHLGRPGRGALVRGWKSVVQVQALVRVVRRDRSFEATARS